MNSENRPGSRPDQPGWGEPPGGSRDSWGAPYGPPAQPGGSGGPGEPGGPGGSGAYGARGGSATAPPGGSPSPAHRDPANTPGGLGQQLGGSGSVPPHGPPVTPGSPSPYGPLHGAPGGPGGPHGPGRFGPPPRRRKSGNGLLIGGIAGGGLALILIVALIIMMVSGGPGASPISGGDEEKAAADLKKAGQQLANVAAAQYKGTAVSGGNQSQIDVKVTKSGSSTGSMNVGGKDVSILTVDSQTYAKGDTDFWTKQGVRSTSASQVGDNWGRLDFDDAKDFQLPSPSSLAQTLQQINEDKVDSSEETTLNGVKTLKVSTPEGTYWVTTADPRRILRMELSKDGGRFTLDMTPVAGPQLAQLYKELKEQVQKLEGARDPNVFVAASPQVKFGTRTFSSITIKATVTPNASGAIRSIRATMNAKMTSGSEKIGGCTGSKTIKASGSTTMTCVNSSGAWKSWYSKAQRTPGFHRYFARVNVVAYAYADANVKAISAKIDQEEGGA